jgi:putative ABC transport system permease protein
MINVEASGPEFMDSAQAEVSTVLRLRHRITGEDDFVISSQQGLIETLEATTTTLVIFLGTIAGISLVVGGIGVMNIMLVSVTERTREIGIRKAIGAKRRDIMFQFLTEAIILTIGGGLVGMMLGYGMTPALNGLQIFGGQGMSLGIRYDVGLIALLVSAIIGLFSGIYPAMRASAMAPIDALRYE